MKKVKMLLLTFIVLLSSGVVTYAAHYVEIDSWNALEEGDSFEKMSYINYTKNDGTTNKINYYVPVYENDVLNGCKYKLYQTDTYEENKTHTTPVIEEYNYVWSSKVLSWMYNGCYLPTLYMDESTTETNYATLDRQEIHLFAYPKVDITIECDKEFFENEEPVTCEVKLNSPLKVKNIEFTINSNGLDLQDVTMINNRFTYDETTNKVSAPSYYDYANNETIFSFKVVGTKETKLEIENIAYSNYSIGEQKADNVEKTIKVETEEPANPEPEQPEKPEENPKTGVEDYYILFIAVLLISAAVLYKIKDKKCI